MSKVSGLDHLTSQPSLMLCIDINSPLNTKPESACAHSSKFISKILKSRNM